MSLKEVNGKTYISIRREPDGPLLMSCRDCAGYDDGELCTDLEDNDCSIVYVWQEQEKAEGNCQPAPKDIQDQKPGTKYDADKTQYSLVPPHALKCIADNLTAGLKKYKERDNWKKVPNAQQRYLDALYRHLEAHRRGELYDTDSSVENMPHLAAVAVNAMFLLEFMLDPDLEEVKGE